MRPRSRWLIAIAGLIVGAVVGALVGNSIHYQSSLGGLGGVLGAGFALIEIAVLIAVSALIALIAGLVHRTGIAVVFGAVAGGLVVGSVLGWLTGPTYRPLIVADADVTT